MNRAWWIGAALLLSGSCVIVLSGLEAGEARLGPEHSVIEAFRSQAGLRVDEDNLVDALSAVPLTLAIDKAGWKPGVLSLDLRVDTASPARTDVYGDMAWAMHFAFRGAENVERLLLRVVALDPWTESKSLLLSADIRRADWRPELSSELAKAGEGPLPEAVKRQYRINESHIWKNRFRLP